MDSPIKDKNSHQDEGDNALLLNEEKQADKDYEYLGSDLLNDNQNFEIKGPDDDEIHKKKEIFKHSKPEKDPKPFISMESLNKCQCCEEHFDKGKHLPLLFSCGHFFCKDCIQQFFSSDQGISCPSDGVVAQTINELKVLKKLVDEDKKTEQITFSNDDAYCSIHKNQKLTHFIEETRELICVYCAVNKMRSNPKFTIKEISEKCKEYADELEVLTKNHQKFADTLQDVLNEINSNKVKEEKKINSLYDQMISYLQKSKNIFLNKIVEIYNDNKKTVAEKLDFLSHKIEAAEKLKEELKVYSAGNFNELVDKFNLFIRDSNDNSKMEMKITEYNFSHDDENKVLRSLNNFGDLKSKKKTFSLNQFNIIKENPKSNSIRQMSLNEIGNQEFTFEKKEPQKIRPIHLGIDKAISKDLNKYTVSNAPKKFYESEGFARSNLPPKKISEKYSEIEENFIPTSFNPTDTGMGEGGEHSKLYALKQYNFVPKNEHLDYNFNYQVQNRKSEEDF